LIHISHHDLHYKTQLSTKMNSIEYHHYRESNQTEYPIEITIHDTKTIDNMSDQYLISQINTLHFMEQFIDLDEAPNSVIDELSEMYMDLVGLLKDITSKVSYHMYSMVYYIFSAFYIFSIIHKLKYRSQSKDALLHKKRV
jgi:hypothetical protein